MPQIYSLTFLCVVLFAACRSEHEAEPASAQATAATSAADLQKAPPPRMTDEEVLKLARAEAAKHGVNAETFRSKLKYVDGTWDVALFPELPNHRDGGVRLRIDDASGAVIEFKRA